MNPLRSLFALSFLYCSAASVCFGQTPTHQETIEWINEKLQQYRVFTSGSPVSQSVSIQECTLTIRYEAKESWLNEIVRDVRNIPLGVLVPTTIESNDEVAFLMLRTKEGKRLIRIQGTLAGVVTDEHGSPFLSEASLKLDIASEKDDVPGRLKKALDHLITSCGGRFAKEVF